MKLSQLLSIYPQLKWGADPTAEISSICVDSRKAEPGCVFVAVRGYSVDGHAFLPAVCEKGAAAVVVESEANIPISYQGAVVVVDDTRNALNMLAGRYYGEPAQEMYCVGVTGTNGKTSVAYMVEAILTEFGWKTGVMGTINHHLGDHVWQSQLTTPDPLVLQKRLQEFRALDAQAVAFEVSSHAIVQRRADHIPFDAVVFTNLTRDHLDYHKDMQEYFRAKERLFCELPLMHLEKRVTAVINVDDSFGREIRVVDGAKVWTYGSASADFSFRVLKEDFSGTEFELSTPRGILKFKIPMPGVHNVYNATAAVAVGLSAGVSLEVCKAALAKFTGVPGRLEAVNNDSGVFVFVDYAHTDDALRSVLHSLRQVRQRSGLKSRIITVFGCGGDRDKGKRPLMMKAAIEASDYVFVTSDNPRTEPAQAIIDEIIAQVPSQYRDHQYFTEVDRRTAISRALQMAGKGDVVLIAGKGHEDYQIVGNDRVDFSDVQVAREFLK